VVLSATLVGDIVQVNPVDGETVAVNDIVPVNPSRPVTVIVEVPAASARAVTLVGEAATVKSWIVYVTVAEWDSELLVPVTVTV
jgi:hypothetical protein